MTRKNISMTGLVDHAGSLEDLLSLLARLKFPLDGLTLSDTAHAIALQEILNERGKRDQLPKPALLDSLLPQFPFSQRFFVGSNVVTTETTAPIEPAVGRHLLTLEDLPELSYLFGELAVSYAPSRAHQILGAIRELNGQAIYDRMHPRVTTLFIRKFLDYASQYKKELSEEFTSTILESFSLLLEHAALEDTGLEYLVDFAQHAYRTYHQDKRNKIDGGFLVHLQLTRRVSRLTKQLASRLPDTKRGQIEDLWARTADRYVQSLLYGLEYSKLPPSQDTRLDLITHAEGIIPSGIAKGMEKNTLFIRLFEGKARLLHYRYDVKKDISDLENALHASNDALLLAHGLGDSTYVQKSANLSLSIAQSKLGADPSSKKNLEDFLEVSQYFGYKETSLVRTSIPKAREQRERESTSVLGYLERFPVDVATLEGNDQNRTLLQRAFSAETELLELASLSPPSERESIYTPLRERLSRYRSFGPLPPDLSSFLERTPATREQPPVAHGNTLEFREYAYRVLLRRFLSGSHTGGKLASERDLITTSFARKQRQLARDLLDVLVRTGFVEERATSGSYSETGFTLTPSFVPYARQYVDGKVSLPFPVVTRSASREYTFPVRVDGRPIE